MSNKQRLVGSATKMLLAFGKTHEKCPPGGTFGVQHCPFLALRDSHSKTNGNFQGYLLGVTALGSFSPGLLQLYNGENKTSLPLRGSQTWGQQ